MRTEVQLVALAGALAWLACAGGCGAGPDRPATLFQRLQSDDPAVRLSAVVEAGRTSDRRALPLLVDRLEDDESAVRMFALESLRKITGLTFDYCFYASPAGRQESVRRWREWLLRGQAASRPAETRPQGG